MSKEDWLDLIYTLEENEMYTEARFIRKHCLKPPTEEEVCKAINKYLVKKAEYYELDNFLNVCYDKNEKWFYYEGEEERGLNYIIGIHKNNVLFIDIDLPPHIITMIGRFYEAQNE